MGPRAVRAVAVLILLAAVAAPGLCSDRVFTKAGAKAAAKEAKAAAKAAAKEEIRRLGERAVPVVDNIATQAIRGMLTARRQTRKLAEARREDELDRVVHETYTADMLLLKTLQYDIPFTKDLLRELAALAVGLISAPIAEETFEGLEARVGEGSDDEESLAAAYIDEYASAVADGGEDAAGRMDELEEAIQATVHQDYDKVIELLRLPLQLAASTSKSFTQPREVFYAENVDPVREWLQESLQRRIREKELLKRTKEQELTALLKSQQEDRTRAVDLMNAYVHWGADAYLQLELPAGASEQEYQKAMDYIDMRDDWVQALLDQEIMLEGKITHAKKMVARLVELSENSEEEENLTRDLRRTIQSMEAEKARLHRKVDHLMSRTHGDGETTRRAEVAYALDMLENEHYEEAMALAATSKFQTDLCGRVSDGLRQTLAGIEAKLGRASRRFALMRRLVNLGRRAGNAVTGALGLFVAGAGAFIGGVGEAAAPVVVAAGYSLTAVASKGSKDLIGLMETRRVAPNEVAQALFQWLIQMLEDPEQSSKYGTDVWYKDQDVCYQRVYEVFDLLTMLHDNLHDKVNSIDKAKRARMMNNERSQALLEQVADHRTHALVKRAKAAIIGWGTTGVNVAKAGVRAGKNAGGKVLKVPSRKKEL